VHPPLPQLLHFHPIPLSLAHKPFSLLSLVQSNKLEEKKKKQSGTANDTLKQTTTKKKKKKGKKEEEEEEEDSVMADNWVLLDKGI
jgi:hypothetical protein